MTEFFFLSGFYQAKVRKSRNLSEKKHLKQEIKSLRGELKLREDKAITEILTKADVVLATNTSASSDGPLKLVKLEHFDLVVIDEAAQSLEAGCWIPLMRAPRYVVPQVNHATGIQWSIRDFARLRDPCLKNRDRDFACKKSEPET